MKKEKREKEYKKVKSPSRLDGLRVINNTDEMVKILSEGETIAHFEWGTSMHPIFPNGGYCRLTPTKEIPNSGDAVFCCVDGVWMTHMVWVANKASGQCLIGSTSGSLYGWTDKILAVATPMPYIEEENNEQ